MKTQTLLFILFGTLMSYFIIDIRFEQEPEEKINSASNNANIALIDSLPKYFIEKDGIVTPKGMKYHILIVPPDTTQNWKMQQMLIEKSRKFHMLLPEIK